MLLLRKLKFQIGAWAWPKVLMLKRWLKLPFLFLINFYSKHSMIWPGFAKAKVQALFSGTLHLEKEKLNYYSRSINYSGLSYVYRYTLITNKR